MRLGMFEKPPLPDNESAPVAKIEALDTDWYARFEKIGAFQAYEYLSGKKEYFLDDAGVFNGGVNEEQKQLFLRDENANLDISYPKLEKLDTQKIEASLLALKEDVRESEKEEVIRQAYLWKINEKLAEIRMLKAAQTGDDRRFTQYSKFIFGEPDPAIFDYTLFELSQKLRPALTSDNTLIRDLAKRLDTELLAGHNFSHTETLSYDPLTSKVDLGPSDDNPFRFPKDIAAPKKMDRSATLSVEEICSAFEVALNEYSLDGWRVVLNETSSNISVNQESKTVNIPKKKKLKQLELEGLIAHEIGVHARRRERGERSKLKLLGLGLDRSKDDEGVAVYEEQKVTGAKDFAGFDGYLAIALAMGADGKKRNFREVFEILRDYHIAIGKTPEKAADSAWARSLRTFRGTSGKTRGACFTKDLIYRDGNIGVWHLVQENSAEQRRFSVGKYDPSNPRHIWILDQLGITDEELKRLESE